MTVSVLLVGNELLAGFVQDRNLEAVASALEKEGAHVTRCETCGDDIEEIADAVKRLSSADFLVITGGLGPTEDDVTRDGLARALGTRLRVDESVHRELETRAKDWGLTGGAHLARQAAFPEGATAVPNPVGSAPGIRARLGGCELWALPGVPAEVRAMLPSVLEDLPRTTETLPPARVVATAGLSEVRAAQAIEAAGFARPEGLRLAFLPGPGGVRLRVSAHAPGLDAALTSAERHLREIFGGRALTEGSVVESLVRHFEASGLTLSTAESCTGGLIGGRITDVPGASAVYLGGIVAYDDRAKTDRLGVDPGLLRSEGAVAEPTVLAMAEGCFARFGSSMALAVTGIAGPTGGSEDRPVGTVWIAVRDREGSVARRHRFPGSREMVRERTVNKSLEMAYRRARGTLD